MIKDELNSCAYLGLLLMTLYKSSISPLALSVLTYLHMLGYPKPVELRTSRGMQYLQSKRLGLGKARRSERSGVKI